MMRRFTVGAMLCAVWLVAVYSSPAVAGQINTGTVSARSRTPRAG